MNLVKLSRDHPRLRGKDLQDQLREFKYEGSPPLTRERQKLDFCSNDLHGITPAYAGKTTPVLAVSSAVRDHPRLRGKDVTLSVILTVL